MVAYQFYWFDKTEKAHFIGIFRERRRNPLRKVIGDNAGATGIYFIQVDI